VADWSENARKHAQTHGQPENIMPTVASRNGMGGYIEVKFGEVWLDWLH